jgi:hypothetical protein
VPRLAERALAAAGQLALVAVGVYLGLRADEWRDARQKSVLARRTLGNFRDEVAANRDGVRRAHPYHDSVSVGLSRLFAEQLRTGRRLNLIQVTTESGYDGFHTVDFQSTAYDLALATQALGELPPALGLRLARLYTRQRSLATFQDQFAQALLGNTPAPRDDASRPLFMLQQGMRSIAVQEVPLVAAYDSALAAIDSTLARR